MALLETPTAQTIADAPGLTLAELEAFDSHAQRTAREIITRCPFCGGSERAFHVNRETGLYNCKRASCGARGKLKDFRTERPKLTRRQRAQVELKQRFSLPPAPMPQPTPEDAPAHWRETWEAYEAAEALDGPGAQAARDWLDGRGVGWEAAQRAGARFCRQWAPRGPDTKPYSGAPAILFPLRDMNGALRAVNGRYLMPQPARDGGTVKARTGGNAKEGAFWVSTARSGPKDAPALLMVEGPIDALAAALCGAPALALCGTAAPSWIGRAVGLRPAYIALDADAGGNGATPAIIEALTYQHGARRLRPEGGKDFGEAVKTYERDWLAYWLRCNAPAIFPAPKTGLKAAHHVTRFRMRHFDWLLTNGDELNQTLINMARRLYATGAALTAGDLYLLSAIENEIESEVKENG